MKAFFAKVWNATKTFFAKVCKVTASFFKKTWAVSMAHKAIAISVAATVVVGTTCAIVLPIALHNHKFADAWCTDAENHWHTATCKHEEEKSDLAAHTFDNDCDAKCDVCGYERTVGAHTYDNACDTTCNTCGATRSITHVFNVEAANTETLKAAATATTKAQYWKSCACGEISTTEYFETDKTEGTLANIQDLSKTYDKVELANPAYTTNSDGTATFEWYQGDTKLDAKPLNAGTYKVKVIIAESATYTGISVEREFTIAKRTIWATDVEFVYWGFDNCYGDQATAAVTFENLANGDTLDAGDVWFEMTGINAGSTLAGIYFDGAGNNITDNYEFDLSKCTASIVPKVLNVSKTFEYAGSDIAGRQLHAPDASLSGVIAGDELYIDISFESGNAGALVLTGEDAPYLDGADCDNYALGTYDFEIVPYDIDISSLKYRKEYDAFSDTITVIPNGRLTGVGTETISFYVEMSTEDVDSYVVGSYFGGSANTANYTFGGMTAEEFKEYAENNAQITPKPLRMVGFAEKNYDGNNTFTYVFSSYNGTLDGNVVTVTFKLRDTATENEAINVGAYTGATIYDAVIDDGNYVFVTTTCDAYVLDTNPLVLECDQVPLDDGAYWILLVTVKQGTLGIGDKIVLSGSSTYYQTADIEKSREFVPFAFAGDQVGIYLDGQELSNANEIPAQSLMYRKDEIPEMATEFLAVIYLRTEEEGGRHSPIFSDYKPNMRGLGKEQQVTVDLIDVYENANDTMLVPGGRALVKITLTTPLPACMLETLEIGLFDNVGYVANGSVYSDIIESHNHGNSMVATDKFDAVAGMPTVIKLTNTRDETLDTLNFYYETEPGSGNYITNFTIKLYDSSFSLIDGTFDNQTGVFTKADSSRWELAEDETCYIVLTTENDTAQVFGWLL